MTGTALAIPTDAEISWLTFNAERLARSKLVPRVFQGQSDDILIVGLALRAVGIDLTVQTIRQCYVIDNRPEFMAQLQAAIAHSNGIDVWHEMAECTDTAAVVHIKPPGRPERTYDYTIDDARGQGLLDEWVEKWEKADGKWRKAATFVVSVDGAATAEPVPKWAQDQIAAGNVKRKDPWFKSRRAMLMARATTKGLKYAAPHVLLGLGGDPDLTVSDAGAPEGLADRPIIAAGPEDDDDIIESEVVEEEPAGGPDAEPDRTPPPGEPLVSADWVQRFVIAVREYADQNNLDADELRHAIVWSCTARTQSSRAVLRGQETDAIHRLMRDLQRGSRYVDRGAAGGLIFVEYKPGEEQF